MMPQTLHDLVSGRPTAEEFDRRLQAKRLSFVASEMDGATLFSSFDVDNVSVWSTADLEALASGIFDVGCYIPSVFIVRKSLRHVLPSGLSLRFPCFLRGSESLSVVIKLVSLVPDVVSAISSYFCKENVIYGCSQFCSDLLQELDETLHAKYLSEQQVSYKFLASRHDVLIEPIHLEEFPIVASRVLSKFLC